MKIQRILSLFFLCLTFQNSPGQEFEFMHDNIMRSYTVYDPTNNLNPNGYPLIIGLHGTGSNGNQFIATAALIQKANAEKFIIACPDAFLNDRFTFFNIGGNFEELTNGTDYIGFVAALIDTMIKNYNVDTTRIYAMGFSNSTTMSYRLAAQLSHKIAAIGAVSGQIVYPADYIFVD